MKASKDRRQVRELFIHFSAPCTGATPVYHSATRFTQLPISSNGKFKFNGTYTEPVQKEDGSQAGSAAGTISLHGKFKRSKTTKRYSVSGDYSVVADLTFSDGGKAHCQTGTFRWSAALSE